MKKSNLFIATLLVVAAITIAMVSCKKDNQDVLLNNPQSVNAFTPPVVDDMNAYLKGFKQKMKESQNAKDAEYLSLEEAAWHLSSVANYDFANTNVQFTDLLYDTLYYQVNVTNGQIALSDLNAIYASIESDLNAYYKSLNLQDKHFRFIGASISEDGQVIIDMAISYIILDHTWYFDDDYYAALACYEWFESNVYYTWNTYAIEHLKSALNYYEGKYYVMPGENPTERTYYIYNNTVLFNHENNIDTIDSPFYGNSRVFAVRSNSSVVPTLEINNMCYCLDSYLALPFEYLQDHHSSMGMINRPIHWNIYPNSYYNSTEGKYYYCHEVVVKFGYLVATEDGNEY